MLVGNNKPFIILVGGKTGSAAPNPVDNKVIYFTDNTDNDNEPRLGKS